MKTIFFFIFSLFFNLTAQTSLDEQLFEAVKVNDLENVTDLVNQGANVNTIDKDGGTVLMWAAYKSDLELVKFLIEKGADYKKKGVIWLDSAKTGWYGNLLAVAAGENKLELLKYFIEVLKIDINDREYNPNNKSEDGWAPLHWAACKGNNEIIIFCLSVIADINLKDSEGNTPVTIAINFSFIKSAMILHCFKADLKIKNNVGKNAIDMANGKEDSALLKFFTKEEINIFDFIEIDLENLALAKLESNPQLANLRNEEGETPLFRAIYYNKINLINKLIEIGADINAVDNDGNTPLIKSLFWLNTEIAKLLIEKGTDLNIKNNIGWTSFYLADIRGYNDIKKLIISKHANQNIYTELKPGLIVQIGHTSSVNSVSFSHDGKYIASGSSDKTIKLWDVNTGNLIRSLEGHTYSVNSVSFSPDGKYIASGSRDGTIKLWDVNTGKLIRSLEEYRYEITSVNFSPNGKYIASGSLENNIRLWDVNTGKLIRSLEGHNSSVTSVTFSPDGKYIASGSDDKTIILWDVSSGKLIRSLEGHAGDVNSVSFSPDGKYLASGSNDETIKLWDVSSFKLFRSLERHTSSVEGISFSHDGKYIVCGCEDGTIKQWGVFTGKLIRTLKGHIDNVTSISFSPDGKYIVSCGDNTIKQWDVNTGKLFSSLEKNTGSNNLLAFSPDKKYCAIGSMDNTIMLLDVKSKELIHSLKGHTGFVTSVSFSPDGKYLVSGSRDNTIRQWNITSGKELASLISFDSTDWAVVTPEGYYDCSEGAKKYIHYTLGLETIDLDQFAGKYEPNLLPRLLGTGDFADEKLEITGEELTDLKLYPEIKDEHVDAEGNLNFKMLNRGGGIGKTEIFINGKEIIADARGEKINYSDSDQVSLTVPLKDSPFIIPGKYNDIIIQAYNTDSKIPLVSRGTEVVYDAPGMYDSTATNLYAVIVGVSDYTGSDIDLNYAAKDAEDFANALNTSSTRLLEGSGNVHIRLLTTKQKDKENKPTKENIISALTELKNTNFEDIVLVYFSGHGVNHDSDFCYLTMNAKSTSMVDWNNESISSKEILEYLKVKARKQAVILDVCGSGGFGDKLIVSKSNISDQQKAVQQMRDKGGMYILAGCSAGKESYEVKTIQQGLLTYSILTGLKGPALDLKGFIDIADLFNFTEKNVLKLADVYGKKQKPVIRIPYSSSSFYIGQILPEDASKIILVGEKPYIIPSLVLDPDKHKDHLGITKKLNDAIKEISDNSKESKFIYFDVPDMADAFQISGDYKVEDKEIKASILVSFGEKDIESFEISGNTDKLDEFIKTIINNTEKIIDKKK